MVPEQHASPGPPRGAAPAVRRRALVAGGAWAIPTVAVATAAPAFAASPQPCTGTPEQPPWFYTNRVAGGLGADWQSPVATLSTTMNGSTVAGSYNLGVVTVDNGVMPGKASYVEIKQQGDARQGQTVTLTFTTPVYGLRFHVNDIDTQQTSGTGNRYRDQVQVTARSTSSALTVRAGATYPGQVTVAGSGTASVTAISTYTASTVGSDSTHEWDYSTSSNGNVDYAIDGPVKTLTLLYTNQSWMSGTGATNQQQIYLSPMTYYTQPCYLP